MFLRWIAAGRRKLQRVGKQVVAKQIKIKKTVSGKNRGIRSRGTATKQRVAIVRVKTLQLRIATTPIIKVALTANKIRARVGVLNGYGGV
jgi:hypothetical protein